MSNGNNFLAQTIMPLLFRTLFASRPLVCRLLIAAVVSLMPSASRGQTLSGHVEVSISATNFTYTIFNDEAQGSALSVSAFYLELDAPIQAILSPSGWSFDTDGASYIAWTCTNGSPPFTNDITPGASLSGFVVQCPILTTNGYNCGIVSSDTAATNAGPVFNGTIAAPSITSMVPSLVLSQSAGLFEL